MLKVNQNVIKYHLTIILVGDILSLESNNEPHKPIKEQRKYGITDITKPSDQEKKIYAFSCGKIYNYIAITNDYITESRKLLKEMKEMV